MTENSNEKMVPLNVQVPNTLRIAVKVAAARSGQTMQNWLIDVLEAASEEVPQEAAASDQ